MADDHGALIGLSDDDHSQYVLADGSRDITGNQTVNGIVTAEGLNIPDGGEQYVKGLSANKIIYVRTTGNDSNDGTTANTAFLTPGRAIEEANKYFIGEYLFCIDVGEGTFNCSATLNPGNSEGAKIIWTGKTFYEHRYRQITTIDTSVTALSDGLEYIDFEVPFTANDPEIVVGHYLLIKGAKYDDHPELINGCHEVVAWNNTTKVATVRCVRVAGSTKIPDGSHGGIAAIVTVVKTVLNFNSGSHGIYVSGGYHAGNWDKMVLKGTLDLNYTGIWMLRGAKIALGESFGTSKWHTNLSCQYGSNMKADYSVHSYSYACVATVSTGGALSLCYAIVSGGRGVGVRAFDGAPLNFQGGTVICAGAFHSIQAFRGGFINALSSVVEGCVPTGIAFYVTSGGGIDSSNSTDDAATARGQEAAPGGNGSYHVY